MYFVYVLLSEKDGQFYTGHAKYIENRASQHNEGKVISTRNRTPFKLVYYEASLNIGDAIHREKYLKTT
ncbi:unnamed protein product, partial [marine sediment metagenome]